MKRCLIIGASLFAFACAPQSGLQGPFWDVGGNPQPGYTYEGRIGAFVMNGRPGIPVVDETNLHLITWPEGTVVPTTMSRTPALPIREDIDLVPDSDLEPDRWYAVRWDSPDPVMPAARNYLLLSAVQLDEDSFAWPFWSTSGPILFSLVWDSSVSLVMVNYSARVEPGPEYEGTVTQGDAVCRLERFTTNGTIEGDCVSLDMARPITLHLSGLLSAGTGVALTPVHREILLGPDGPFAQLAYPLEWPPFEGMP